MTGGKEYSSTGGKGKKRKGMGEAKDALLLGGKTARMVRGCRRRQIRRWNIRELRMRKGRKELNM